MGQSFYFFVGQILLKTGTLILKIRHMTKPETVSGN